MKRSSSNFPFLFFFSFIHLSLIALIAGVAPSCVLATGLSRMMSAVFKIKGLEFLRYHLLFFSILETHTLCVLLSSFCLRLDLLVWMVKVDARREMCVLVTGGEVSLNKDMVRSS